jgi:hypothetical protein
MPWGAVAGAAIGLIGSSMSSSAQSDAAQQGAQAQEQAAQLQANTSAAIYNSQQQQNLPARESGGLAMQRQDYLLGLTPNLNITPDYTVNSINPSLAGGSANVTNTVKGTVPNAGPSNFGGQPAAGAPAATTPAAAAAKYTGGIPGGQSVGSNVPNGLSASTPVGGISKDASGNKWVKTSNGWQAF